MELYIKKRVSRDFSETGTDTEKGQFGLGYGHKIRSYILL